MKKNLWGNAATQFFYDLNPDLILSTVDALGFSTTGRVMQLNSMENRVYEVEIDSNSDNPSDHSKIIKFYRPGRWTLEQLQEEHDFMLDLHEAEIPVIAPIEFDKKSLFTHSELGLHYTVFNKQGGRAPDEFNDEEIEQVGRLLARLHNVGSMRKAEYRLTLNPETYLQSNLAFLLDQKIIPAHTELAYKTTLEQIYTQINPLFKNIHYQRIHGDCHLGNILRRSDTFHLIDFDDFVMGPCVQDLWLLLPGRDEYADNLRNIMLEAYETMRDFNNEELRLIEPLRALRMINYSAWIAKRFSDPAFKNAFPYFDSPTYWEGHLNDLREQVFHFPD
jgi:Ser/Thr protein kinase RdoA (MazF antagonist)